jgi:hypothetical protein
MAFSASFLLPDETRPNSRYAQARIGASASWMRSIERSRSPRSLVLVSPEACYPSEFVEGSGQILDVARANVSFACASSIRPSRL